MVTAVLFPPSAAECERRGFNPETVCVCVCVSHCSGVCASTVVYAVTQIDFLFEVIGFMW